jgi:hypothetical protein
MVDQPPHGSCRQRGIPLEIEEPPNVESYPHGF